MWQFGGLAIMPMALLVLSGDRTLDFPIAGYVGAALAFLMTGFGMHMTQTAGLALAADRATEETRPKVVALALCDEPCWYGVCCDYHRRIAA